jgi:hypothetical protein
MSSIHDKYVVVPADKSPKSLSAKALHWLLKYRTRLE